MRKSTQSKLIASSGKAFAKSNEQPPTSSFIVKMQYYPDAKEATQIIAEQAGLEFDKTQDGENLQKQKALQIDLDESFKVTKATQNTLEDKLKNTKQYIKSGNNPNAEESSKTGFLNMGLYDQISLLFLFMALPTCLFMGAANVYSNLLASGEAVFLEQPYLAVFISMLVPAGSTSIKFISNFFEYQSSKKRYTLLIYTLTALVLLIWSFLFSMSFTGVASDIDWESLGEAQNRTDSFLVWMQLVAEILVSAALFLAAEDIYLKYSPNITIESLEYINAKKALDTHSPIFEKQRDARNQTMADIAVLTAKRTAFTNEQVAEFMAMRARNNQFN